MINTARDFKNWAWIWSLNAILNCTILVMNLIQNLETNKHTAAKWNSTQQTLSGNFVSWTKKPLYVKYLLLEWVMDFIYPKTYIVLLAVVASENLQNHLSLWQTRSCSGIGVLSLPYFTYLYHLSKSANKKSCETAKLVTPK